MNPFKNFRLRKNNVKSLATAEELIGWHPVGINTLEHYKENQYENGYGSISKIVNTFMDIKPYTVNERGERVDSLLQQKLYHPNQDMSSSDFREALAVMSLIHDRVFILCWRNEGGVAKPGGIITPNNLAGFTFLENPTVTLIDKKKIYTYKGNTYGEHEVIELKDINPYNLHAGFSAAKAARKWATIDDYIAAYQSGFFKNGAVPAGQFIITATTAQEFNDEVDKLEAKHKGAGKNNNIVYVHRPMDREGKPSNAKIEWIPFNVQNKDLALNDIFEQANKKIDSVYGVPAEIRGILSNSNYASVTVAERIFIKYVMKPFTQKIYTRFTHQLNRITGGMGVAISFELEVPGLVDEEKVDQEAKKIKDERVQLYLDRGYTIESIKAYLVTDDLEKLEMPVIDETVDDPDAVIDDPEDAPDSLDGSGDGTELYGNIRPIVKAQSGTPDVDLQLVPYEQQIEALLNTQINKQAARKAATIQDAAEDANLEEEETLANDILAVLMAIMIMRGNAVYNEAVRNALNQGFDVTGTSKYSAPLPEDAYDQLLQYVKSFTDDTANEISSAVATAIAAGMGAQAIRTMLSNFSATQGYRVNRFSQNEAWNANEQAKLGALVQITDELNQKQTIVGFKTWRIQPGACPICTPYNGERVEIDSFFSNGLKIPPIHVQCRCDIDESWEKVTVANSIERNLHCKECDRFLGTTTQDSYTDKIKCGNSKCKALEIPVIKESE